MNEPIRSIKEDRYCAEKTKLEKIKPGKRQSASPSAESKPFLSKQKLFLLVLALVIVTLLLILAIFKPTKQEQPITDAILPKTDSTQSSERSEYQRLTPPSISTDVTETKHKTSPEKEYIEIPGEITDLLSQNIHEFNESEQKLVKNNSEKSGIELKGQNISTDEKFNEFPLEKAIENSHYTIQIDASFSLEDIMTSIKAYKLTNYQIYETQRDKRPWFILIKGDYPTLEDAKEAIKSLQSLRQNLTEHAPWIKSGVMVNKEKQAL